MRDANMISKPHAGHIVAVHNGLTVLDCWQCGYKHLDPLPSEREVESYYRDDQFYQGGNNTPDWFTKEANEHELGLWNTCYDYQCELLDTSLPLLDVGTGCGWFVRHYQYWNKAWGIEPSVSAREIGGIGNYIYPDRNAFLAKRGWVVPMNIRMALVLEHVVDPYREIVRYMGHLGREGKMMVVVPNDFSGLQRKIGGHHWISKVHINYFNEEGIRGLLAKAGLKTVHVSTTYPIERNILKGRDYRGDDALGRQCHMERLQFEKKHGTRAFIYYHLLYKLFGWGRELIVVAKKG